MYACDVCNELKGWDWHAGDPVTTGRGYLDPSEHDYDLHFRFLDDGIVEGLTSVAKYMIERLHLNRGFVVNLRATRVQKKELLEYYDKVISQARRKLTDVENPEVRSELRSVLSELSTAKAQTQLWLQSISTCRRESYWASRKQERIGGSLSDAIKRAREESKLPRERTR